MDLAGPVERAGTKFLKEVSLAFLLCDCSLEKEMETEELGRGKDKKSVLRAITHKKGSDDLN